MSAISRLVLAPKTLCQLGLQQVGLYARYKFGLLTGHYRRVTRRIEARESRTEPASNLESLFSFPPQERIHQTIGQDGLQTLLAEADEIAAGKARLFGGGPVPLQLTLDQPLQHWTAYETRHSPLPINHLPIPDIKFIWEPARFGFAFTLGRAYHVSGDEKYAEAFWRYAGQFLDGSPPYLGPHWMNGQEVAIRLMAFVWAAQVFAGSKHSTPERKARLAQAVAQHAARIPPTLIYARAQNNNHLVAEAAGLFTAGLALPDHPDAARWRALGWKWLNRAFQRQIGSYGEYIQHSTNYHRLVLQAALWVDAILRSNDPAMCSGQRASRYGCEWPRLTFRSLARASHWMFSMLDPAAGRSPNLGANDGAYLFPLSICPFADFRPVVQAAARAFLRSGMPPGVWDEMSLWLDLPPSEKTVAPDVYLTDNLRGRNSWAYLRASPFKSRLAHMDQLHLDLWWRGLNIAQDAGTYLYNAEPPWDNPLVSTRVHNTVTVDGRDQMRRGGRFLTLDWFPAYSKNLLEADERILQRLLAYHKGYRRLGIRHERTVTVYADERWEVKDDLLVSRPGRPHTFRLHWLLPDRKWKIEAWGSGIGLRLKSPNGWTALHITPGSRIPNADPRVTNPEYRIALIRAGELIYGQGQALPFEGWLSSTYGQKVPALSLAVEVTSSQSTSFLSEFNFPP